MSWGNWTPGPGPAQCGLCRGGLRGASLCPRMSGEHWSPKEPTVRATVPHLFFPPAFWNGPGRKTCHRGKNPNAREAGSSWPNEPCLSEAGGNRISVGRAAACFSHWEACKRILKMSSKSGRKDRSLSHSLPNFPPLPSEVRPGSLESERNAHCHSQIHGTKPGWEPRQKPRAGGD